MSSTAIRRPPTPSAGDSTLWAVGEQLRLRGWKARIDTYDVAGESDERLVVEQAGERCVELLGTWGNAPCGAGWHAVRVASEARVVWCGPPHACEPTDLVRFVEDLLSCDPGELGGHYPRLGQGARPAATRDTLRRGPSAPPVADGPHQYAAQAAASLDR